MRPAIAPSPMSRSARSHQRASEGHALLFTAAQQHGRAVPFAQLAQEIVHTDSRQGVEVGLGGRERAWPIGNRSSSSADRVLVLVDGRIQVDERIELGAPRPRNSP